MIPILLFAHVGLGGLGGLGGHAAPIPVEFHAPAETVVTYPPDSVLFRHSGQRLSEVAQEAWESSFAKTSFFSAFAYAKDGGYGFATTANTPDAARAIALAQCHIVNDRCRVIAEIHPAGYKPPIPDEVTVSVEIAGYYRDTRAQDPFRAMAISNDGAYATAWGYPTQADADALALADCESHRDLSIHAPGDWPCFLLPGLD